MMVMSTYEAKTRLSELLALVEIGVEVTITRNRRPVARLVPVEKHQRDEVLNGQDQG
jgi:prevent-host-death family protein